MNNKRNLARIGNAVIDLGEVICADIQYHDHPPRQEYEEWSIKLLFRNGKEARIMRGFEYNKQTKQYEPVASYPPVEVVREDGEKTLQLIYDAMRESRRSPEEHQRIVHHIRSKNSLGFTVSDCGLVPDKDASKDWNAVTCKNCLRCRGNEQEA